MISNVEYYAKEDAVVLVITLWFTKCEQFAQWLHRGIVIHHLASKTCTSISGTLHVRTKTRVSIPVHTIQHLSVKGAHTTVWNEVYIQRVLHP